MSYHSPFKKSEIYEPAPFSSGQSVFEYSNLKKHSLQQKQIEDLQEKVDIILMHNEQLIAENNELKYLLLQSEEANTFNNIHRQKSIKSSLDDQKANLHQFNHALEIKNIQLEKAQSDLIATKSIFSKEMEAMAIIIGNLNESNDLYKQENVKILAETQELKESIERIKRQVKRENQKKSEEEIRKLKIQFEEDQKKAEINKAAQIDQLKRDFEQQIQELNGRKEGLICKLQQNHDQQLSQIRKQFEIQLDHQANKLKEQASQQCREEREKAQILVKDSFENAEQSQKELEDTYKKEIQALKHSLESRKLLVNQLMNSQDSKDQGNWFEEVLALKQRLKEAMEAYFRDSQIFKIKTIQKHENDITEMVKVYENKIDTLSLHVNYLTDQNQTLRNHYEDEILAKIKLKKDFEIEISKLKNLIRKLKIQLHGIQEEFKLNIEGVRQNNNTFSMSMMKSIIQEKDKANFFEEENRKLRQMYERNEKELETMKIQTEEKCKYFEGKLQHQKNLISEERKDLAFKEDSLNQRLTTKEQALRQNLRKEREHMLNILNEMKAENEKLQKQNFDLKEISNSLEVQNKERDDKINYLSKRISEHEGHIQKLRMELEMAGVDNKQTGASIQQWKDHYQRIIHELESDKEHLKEANSIQNEKLIKIVQKYNVLEASLETTVSSIKKRKELDQKIISMGMDGNLIKNLAELFDSRDVRVSNLEEIQS